MSNETTIEIPAPPNMGALLVLKTAQKLTVEQASNLRAMGEGVAARIRAASSTCGEWPVVVVVSGGMSVEWIAAPVTYEPSSSCPCMPVPEP